MVIKLKMAQLIEPDEELVDQFSSTNRGVQKPYLFSKTFVRPVKRQSRGD